MIATDGRPTIASPVQSRPITAPRPAPVARCSAVHPSYRQVRCEGRAGHDGQHGHSFFARYWDDPTSWRGIDDPDASPVYIDSERITPPEA